MSNYHLRDKDLSLKAKGLLSWMLSNNDDWDYSIAGIVACCKEGETTINTALKELQDNGYVEVKKIMPNKESNRIHYEYFVYEYPQGVESQGVESQGLESQGVENQGQRNNNKSITKKSNNNKQYSDNKELDTAIKDFIEHRKKMRKPMTSKAVDLFIKRLKQLSISEQNQIQMVNTAIERGWMTVYPVNGQSEKEAMKSNRSKNRLADLEKYYLEKVND
jgi:DNA-binding transcriptional regulator YhcF (GntR family)